MKKRKIVLLVLLLITTFMFIGCNHTGKVTKYSIKYFVDGIEEKITPSEYTKGEEVILNEPLVEFGYGFSGWYLNADLTGEQVSRITKEDTGDKVFYGKRIELEKPSESYTIKYFVNNIEVSFELNTYKDGDKTKLPIPDLKENETWNGWYETKELSGEKIENLYGKTGNLNLYGTVETTIPQNELEKAFNHNSYKFTATCLVDDLIYEDQYNYDNGNFYIHNDYFDQYYGKVDGVNTYFTDDGEGNFYYVPESDIDFPYYVEGLILFNLKSIDTNKFVKDGLTYKAKEDSLQELCRLFTASDDSFDSLVLTIENGLIKTIEIEATHNDNNEIIENSYLLEFSNFDNVKVELPKNAHYMGDPIDPITIEEVYNLEAGSSVVTEGQVTGIYGNNFYLSNGTKGILVYMCKDDTHKKDVYIGSNIKVSGVVDIYNDVHQIKNIDKLERTTDTFNVESKVINNIKPETLNGLVHDMVTVDNLIVLTLPQSYSNDYSDISFDCKLGNETITIFISKHLDKDIKTNLINFIKTLKVNDVIKVEKAHVGYHKGSYQLCLTNVAEMQVSSQEVVTVGIEVNP